jgi:cbb3-type cytochrome oxidase subunit 3
MTLVSAIGSVSTVLSVLAFAAVIWWAFGRARRERFDAAARAPFALPDEVECGEPAGKRTGCST